MRILLIIFFLFNIENLFSQSFIFPQDYFFDQENQRNILNDSNNIVIHTGIKPILNARLIYGQRNEDSFFKNRKWFGRKIFNEDLIELKHTDYQSGWPRKFNLYISPLIHFQGGIDLKDSTDEKLLFNSRGVLVKGNIDKKFYFESVFLENQATLPQYLDQFVQQTKIVPGYGRWKKFKTNGYDFAYSSGYIAYQINRNLILQLGHGKHHIGNGYRSLLLSDNTFNYPYLRINTNFNKGKFQYTSIYAVLMNLTAGDVTTPIGTEPLFQKKPAAFHFLSWSASKFLNVSLFQSLIWTKADSVNRIKLAPGYFNPLIFSNIASYGLQNQNNIVTGLDIRITPFKNFIAYGQIVLDEFGEKKSVSNKHGWQAGVKYYNAFGIKNLFLNAEMNTVRPFTYSSTFQGQSYTHYNQSLAHPLGANFKELVGIIQYNYKRIYLTAKVNYIEQGINLGTNYGQDIFVSDFSPALNSQTQNQGIQSSTKIAECRVGYLINPKYNLTIFAGGIYREINVEVLYGNDITQWLFVGLKTTLFNNYFDF